MNIKVKENERENILILSKTILILTYIFYIFYIFSTLRSHYISRFINNNSK